MPLLGNISCNIHQKQVYPKNFSSLENELDKLKLFHFLDSILQVMMLLKYQQKFIVFLNIVDLHKKAIKIFLIFSKKVCSTHLHN